MFRLHMASICTPPLRIEFTAFDCSLVSGLEYHIARVSIPDVRISHSQHPISSSLQERRSSSQKGNSHAYQTVPSTRLSRIVDVNKASAVSLDGVWGCPVLGSLDRTQ